MVIHSCDKKYVTQTWIHVKRPYRFVLEVKHQLWKHATNRFMVIDQCAKYDMPMSLRDAYECESKFDLGVKGQRHIGIMNIRDTLSYDVHMIYLIVYQPWCTYFSQGKTAAWTQGCLDPRTKISPSRSIVKGLSHSQISNHLLLFYPF